MAIPTDQVSADEWRAIFTSDEFLQRVRTAGDLPRTELTVGLFLVYRQIGAGEVRYSRVQANEPAGGQSATSVLYDELPELYSDPILFLIEAREVAEGPPAPTFMDLQGLLSFVSAKGFTQMPVGLWLHQPQDGAAIDVFLAQWRGYPELDRWEAVEAAFAQAPPGEPDALASALNDTEAVRAQVDAIPAQQGSLGDLSVADRLAYEVVTFGESGGGFMGGPPR